MSESAESHGTSMLSSFATFIAYLPEPCALVDATGHLAAVNPAWSDMFFDTGLGQPLTEAVARLFAWEPAHLQQMLVELNYLQADELHRVSFDAALAEPPDRWVNATLARTDHGFCLWQLSEVTRWQMVEAATHQLLEQFRDAIESISDGFALYDREERLVFCNRRYREIYPLCADLLRQGRSFREILRVSLERGQFMLASDTVEAFFAHQYAQFREGTSSEYQLTDGRWIRAVNHQTDDGATVGIRTDITEQRLASALREQTAAQEATIMAQSTLLAELSTPLLRISARTLVLPLIGAIDGARANRVVEHLLNAVEEQQASLVILDITGVPVVDTYVAGLMIQCARAIRLLGARMVLTGIRPDVAETLVTLGIDLGEIVTRASLQDGVRYALREG
ncbi:hypothetical protein A9Q02_21540 [Candidatus Chloroploca asiatica]|uniref:STAS domain-containing protein n=2 Tax=Candidatus Chloroploca asiatica TaxID=1506545 RepID=A0A2H3L6Y6_9CHLR|nr:hypothetical protein A9Q02_21540 [Candidatus Chloroploca asiatica]